MKYYLKCNHCAQPNEIKSEYMVLCSSCGQKLENNYTQWQRRNPGATFENYKNSVDITEDKLQPTTPPKKSKSINSGSLKKKILIAVVIIVFTSLGAWLGEKAVHTIRNNKKTDEKVLQEQWVKKTYGSYGLTIETPWELQPVPSPPVPQNVENLIENMEGFGSNEVSDDFIINTTSIKYKAELGQVDVYGGVMGSMNGIEKHAGSI